MATTSTTDDPTVTVVAASTSAVTLFAATGPAGTRQVTNASTATLYLKYGAAAALNSYTVPIGANGGYFELPQPLYTGLVTGIWDAANGSAYCTEVS
jgi:hypothetical protein